MAEKYMICSPIPQPMEYVFQNSFELPVLIPLASKQCMLQNRPTVVE